MYSNSLLSTASTGRCASLVPAKILAVALVLPFAAGCSLLSDQLDRAAKGAGKVVKEYCENITIPEVREEVKAAVNKHAAPHSVAIECVDGGPVLRTGEGEAISEPQPNETAPSPEVDDDGETASLPIIIIDRRMARLPIVIIERRKNSVPRPKPQQLS